MTPYQAIATIENYCNCIEDNLEDAIQAAKFLVETGYAATLPGRIGRLCEQLLKTEYQNEQQQ